MPDGGNVKLWPRIFGIPNRFAWVSPLSDRGLKCQAISISFFRKYP
jgi:hypothetical protein